MGELASVYVLAAEAGPVKIGQSGNARARLSQVRAKANRSDLQIVFVRSCDPTAVLVIEAKAHQLLAARRRGRTEWFDATADEAIAAVVRAASVLGFELTPIPDKAARTALPGQKEVRPYSGRGRPTSQPHTERFVMRCNPSMLIMVDEWRSQQPDTPGRSEAIRRMVRIGIEMSAAA